MIPDNYYPLNTSIGPTDPNPAPMPRPGCPGPGVNNFIDGCPHPYHPEFGTDLFCPDPPLPPPPPKHHPLNSNEELYVRKKQLNEILKNVGEATIFEDNSENGTSISMGGITKGTNLGKITFSQFIQMLLYSDDEDSNNSAYVTQAELKNAVEQAVTASVQDIVNQAVQEAIQNMDTNQGEILDG